MIITSRSYLALVLLLIALIGYSYIEAVALYGIASKTALEAPELAPGMNPLDGVLVPTLGALYLCTTLLFPFVAIRALGQDKESGSLKLSLQWPTSVGVLIVLKLAAVIASWALSIAIPLWSLGLWLAYGGHLAVFETLNLFFGHFLYAFLVVGISFFAVTVTESSATAAILTLAFTLGFWVLDFSSSSGPSWLMTLGEYSPTKVLKQFEGGLFSLPHVLALATLGTGLIALSMQMLPTQFTLRSKIAKALGVCLLIVAALYSSTQAEFFLDLTEDHHNSFNPADTEALSKMDKGLVITVYLAPEDSRARDLSVNVLNKLKRRIPGLKLRWSSMDNASPFAAARSDRYGVVVYEYMGRTLESRSNSPEEILPLLHDLAAVEVVPSDGQDYPGYPLRADTQSSALFFYVPLGLIALILGWLSSRPGRVPPHLNNGESR